MPTRVVATTSTVDLAVDGGEGAHDLQGREGKEGVARWPWMLETTNPFCVWPWTERTTPGQREGRWWRIGEGKVAGDPRAHRIPHDR